MSAYAITGVAMFAYAFWRVIFFNSLVRDDVELLRAMYGPGKDNENERIACLNTFVVTVLCALAGAALVVAG